MSEQPGNSNEICPPRADIYAYSLGALSEAEADDVEQHLLACSQCETLLDALEEPSDALIQSLASLPVSSDDEAAYQTLVRQLDATRGASFTVAGGSTWSEFSRPGGESPLDSLPCRLGNYVLEACIGRGAAGAVYRARHVNLDRTVAVKVLDPRKVNDPSAVTRFVQEMKVVGQMEHAHVVRATDAGEADGHYFLVMDYVAGIDAARVLHRNGPLRVNDAAEIVRQAALGLQFAHERGLIHRDVKPSNLLVTVDGEVKLLDLGIATQTASSPTVAPGSVAPIGTLDYMPPEQWGNAADVDVRADVYTLGGTLYKLLAGHLPWRDECPVDRSANSAISISSLREGVPKELERILGRLLSSSPDGRPGSAQEAAHLLEPFTRGADLRALMAPWFPQRERSTAVTIRPRIDQPPRTRRYALIGLAAAGAAALGWRGSWFSEHAHLRRFEERKLIPVAPELLLTFEPKEKLNFQVAGSGQIDVSSQELALVHLGRPVIGSFRFSVGLAQTGWTASSGVFFKGRLTRQGGQARLCFQSIEVRPPDHQLEPGERRLLWCDWEVTRVAGNLRSTRVPLAEVEVRLLPQQREQQLQVTLGRKGLPEVQWNGQQLHEASWRFSREGREQKNLSPKVLPMEFLGRLGVVNALGSTTFLQPKLTYL